MSAIITYQRHVKSNNTTVVTKQDNSTLLAWSRIISTFQANLTSRRTNILWQESRKGPFKQPYTLYSPSYVFKHLAPPSIALLIDSLITSPVTRIKNKIKATVNGPPTLLHPQPLSFSYCYEHPSLTSTRCKELRAFFFNEWQSYPEDTTCSLDRCDTFNVHRIVQIELCSRTKWISPTTTQWVPAILFHWASHTQVVCNVFWSIWPRFIY